VDRARCRNNEQLPWQSRQAVVERAPLALP
jgi:hypothetical protein